MKTLKRITLTECKLRKIWGYGSNVTKWRQLRHKCGLFFPISKNGHEKTSLLFLLVTHLLWKTLYILINYKSKWIFIHYFTTKTISTWNAHIQPVTSALEISGSQQERRDIIIHKLWEKTCNWIKQENLWIPGCVHMGHYTTATL